MLKSRPAKRSKLALDLWIRIEECDDAEELDELRTEIMTAKKRGYLNEKQEAVLNLFLSDRKGYLEYRRLIDEEEPK